VKAYNSNGLWLRDPELVPAEAMDTVLEIFEQSNRTGPSIDQTSFGPNGMRGLAASPRSI
jgi:hypothetical protein